MSAMSQQELLVALAVIMMITNALGLAFTIWKHHQHHPVEEPQPHSNTDKVGQPAWF
jgi:hypothetical protein